MTSHLEFQGLQSVVWTASVVLAALGAAFLLIWLLLPQSRLVRKSIGKSILALRLAVVGLLTLVLLEPYIVQRDDRELRGRVVVAIDVSDSMSTVDIQATPLEKLRWVKALGIFGTARESELNQAIAATTANDEPGPVPENMLPLLADIERLSRQELVSRLLNRPGSPLEEWKKLADVDVVLFADEADSVPFDSSATSLSAPPAELDTSQSRIAETIATLDLNGDESLLGIVLLSDGRQTLRRPSESGENIQPAAPVLAVPIGSSRPPRDLVLLDIEAPAKILKDDTALLTARFQTGGFVGEHIEITLESEQAPPETQRIEVTEDETSIEFRLDSQHLGPRRYTVRATPRADEVHADNNERSVTVEVVDDRIDVFLADDRARWEFRFLDNALGRDDRIELTHVLHEQPYIGVLNQPFFPRMHPLLATATAPDSAAVATADEEAAEMYVVGDVSPDWLSDAAWSRLETQISEHGSTLVLLAGRRHLPLEHRSPSLERLLPLVEIRPVEIAPTAVAPAPPDDRGFSLRLSPDGQTQTQLLLIDDPAANAPLWQSLAGHGWGLTGRPKPGATVWALAPADETAENSDVPIIVHQPYGTGHVVWIGIDSTWRWRYRVGDRYHHRFWGQLARWSAENRVRVGDEQYELEFSSRDFIAGAAESVTLKRTGRADHNLEQATSHEITVRSLEGASNDSTLTLEPTSGSGEFSASLSNLTAGQYELSFVDPTKSRVVENARDLTARIVVRPQLSTELTDVATDRENLRRLASQSGGRLVEPDQLANITVELRQRLPQRSAAIETPLWNRPFVLFLFLSLLTAEWVLRRLHGLP